MNVVFPISVSQAFTKKIRALPVGKALKNNTL